MLGTLHRYTAFTTTPKGGNPAGVWIGDALPAVVEMQRVAAEVGYSETAFVAPTKGLTRTVRYYSPEKEIDFCGHATVASGVVLGQSCGAGEYRFSTNVGDVPVAVRQRNGQWQAALTSVTPRHEPAPAGLLRDVLAALRWRESDLDPSIPPVRANAGIWHLVMTVRTAALGGYLRDAGLINVPASIVILQGETMGRPSRLEVTIPVAGGIVVSGNAVPMEV